MKVVILAGGRGTRISEETDVIPKPMVEIGGKPIIWHIMKMYSHYGFNEFIICLGYLGYVIKEYFSHYFLHMNDVTINLADNKNEIEVHTASSEPWRITLVDTGMETMTGGRIKRIEKYIGDETFMMTYGDGVGDINIKALSNYHKKHKKFATATAIQAFERFGILDIRRENKVKSFLEKPEGIANWINVGFFVLEPDVFKFIKTDDTSWEKEPLEKLAKSGQLVAYKHTGFWKCMDTMRDKIELEQLWQSGKASWKVWR